ncbi:hypothetical protein [Hymenobacter ruricola]|uniref:DUF3298 domain-containing protein n=1 Tax=Hymenobacter ruricola TaxID=2791023 RepID=A0ABS0HZ31_9BACT|nr:hypothetical protein [Hymenobacter ruricola]MBF9219801.1 hypothetical protein [Hymenobacter ruricola]
MIFSVSGFSTCCLGLLLAVLGSPAAAQNVPAAPPRSAGFGAAGAEAFPANSAEPGADYSVEPVIIKPKKTTNLTVQVTYPRLRPRPGTAATDTVGIAAFNREAQAFGTDLVKEIETTARANRRDKIPTLLQVSFRPYLLQQGLVSVAFAITQDGIGPRPVNWATGLTYDLRTGRKLAPADVLQQNAAFKTLLLSTLQPALDSSSDCQLEPDNMAWDNFVISASAYYVLLGDAQIGRACQTRALVLPWARLKPFVSAGSAAGRLSGGEKR